jgi:hypothetical protein
MPTPFQEDYISDRGTSGLSLSPRGYVERISGPGENQLAIQKYGVASIYKSTPMRQMPQHLV